MDTSINPGINQIPKKEMKPEVLLLAKSIVESAIKKNDSCYWAEIEKEGAHRVSVVALHRAIMEMRKEGLLRTREDDIEHALEYSLVTR
jgi:hypothetical protein